MSSGTRKGQFFIVGALFICSLLYVGAGPAMQLLETPTEDMVRLSGNLGAEVPHALNIGVNSSDAAGTLSGFTNFSRNAALSRGITFESLWVVFEPKGTEVNVSVGNFMGSGKTIGINVSGVYGGIYAASDSVNSTTFSVPGYTFGVAITYDDESLEALLLSNKTSLYCLVSLERGGSVVRKEIYA